MIDEAACYCLTAGQKGKLRLWNLDKLGEVGIESFPVEKSLVAPSRKIDAIHVEDRKLFIAQDDLIGTSVCKPFSIYSNQCGQI